MIDIRNLTDAAWRAANRHAYSRIDENSRHTIAGLSAKLAMGSLPNWQMIKLFAYWAWWEAVWLHYATVRATIASGVEATYDPAVAGVCPGDIWWLTTES